MDEWDKYWSKKKNLLNIIYDTVALFYRKYIIIRALNFFLYRNYSSDSVLLHAGCANGDLDVRVSRKFKLLSLDKSMAGLRINNTSGMRIQGDVFQMPVKNASLDGIYNLGLMEHFPEGRIIAMLKEFDRVLKERGRLIIFWPPEFGLSVNFLKVANVIINKIFKKNIKFHPDEITKIKSYRWVKSICERGNFKIMNYYFGPRDLFTYVVMVLEKDESLRHH
jgi:ubiquinone/menaquinone biosynthesis C-methylase UbiE